MSHTVTTTRTTVVTSGTPVFINTGYLATLPGLLKIAQLLLGAACVGIIGYYFDRRYNGYYSDRTPELLFLLVSTTFLIGTFCLLSACLVSLSAATMISKTVYEIIYHGTAFILYICAGLTLLIKINNKHDGRNYIGTYEPYTAAAIMGLILAGLYLLSTFLAHRQYRGK